MQGVFMANTHRNVTGEIARRYCDIIITTAETVDKGDIEVKENVSWERLKIHAVHHIPNMGRGTEGLPKMPE
jgi:hypothetical protein